VSPSRLPPRGFAARLYWGSPLPLAAWRSVRYAELFDSDSIQRTVLHILERVPGDGEGTDSGAFARISYLVECALAGFV
jgi:hypothetical protein